MNQGLQTTERLRILVPIIGFARAGGYRVLSELANHWADAGAEVDFLVDQRTEPPYFPTRAGIRYFAGDGSEVAAQARVGGFQVAGGNARSIYLGMWRALRRLAAQYDVVLANHSLTAFPVAFAALPRQGTAGRFYYVQAYEPEYYALEPGLRSRVLQMLSTLSYRLPLRQVANAPVYLGYRGIRAREWVPPGLDEALFRRRDTLPGEGPSWTLGVIGRHEPAKGTADALRAFELLAAKYPQVELSIAFGNLPAGWSHPRAKVALPQGDAELAAWYRTLDVMLAPGTVQLGACHYPVLEAMASGVAVVTTGYLPADADNAWIVPVHDPAAIAAAVENVMALPREKLAARLERAAAAIRPFGWRAVAARFLALLRQAA